MLPVVLTNRYELPVVRSIRSPVVDWADGQRTILEIVDRIEMEIGIRDTELVVREFELLEQLGLVTLNYDEGRSLN